MSNFMEINFNIEKYSKDKKTIADEIGYEILDEMQSMFEWRGLPESIPQEWLELLLMHDGFAFVTEVEGKLYAFSGGLGGEPDPYYQPTICTVANPALKFDKECKIGEEGILISNDTLRRGLIPIIGKYAGLLTENTITLRIADILARITNVMSAGDESTIASAEEYLKQLEDGQLGIIEESPFLQDLKVQTAATATGATRLTDLIETEQYLKASLYNKLGLQANYNMKREAVNSTEAQLGDDCLQPLPDNMLKMRRKGAQKLNEMYGLNVSVDFASAWKDNEDIREAEVEILEDEADPEEVKPEEHTGELEEGKDNESTNSTEA